jgi:sRNA-binding carbon storage regulator CsrA
MQEWRGSSTGMRVGIEAPPHINVVREELLLEHDPRRQRTLRRLAGDEE